MRFHKSLLGLLGLFALGIFLGVPASTPAHAAACIYTDAPPGFIRWGDSSNCYLLKVNSDGSINVTASGSGTSTVTQAPLAAVAGTQRALSIATATSLTVPATATTAIIQAQGTNNTSGVCLYWQDDGTAPTASAGQQMAAGSVMLYKVTSLPIQLIAATGATCTATISYYK